MRTIQERIGDGSMSVGPATTTLLLPIVLPWECCQEAVARRCADCGALGWTHNPSWEEVRIRCVFCTPLLNTAGREAILRQAPEGFRYDDEAAAFVAGEPASLPRIRHNRALRRAAARRRRPDARRGE